MCGQFKTELERNANVNSKRVARSTDSRPSVSHPFQVGFRYALGNFNENSNSTTACISRPVTRERPNRVLYSDFNKLFIVTTDLRVNPTESLWSQVFRSELSTTVARNSPFAKSFKRKPERVYRILCPISRRYIPSNAYFSVYGLIHIV